jgi:hypothetical protein
VKSHPRHLAVTRHSVLLPETFYRRAHRAEGRPPVRDLVCSRSNEPPQSYYERVSGNSRRCPGRNSISAADVTNRLGTTRWTSTPSQFVNPEMTECSPAASARKPSRATRSAGSRPIERSSGTPATSWNSDSGAGTQRANADAVVLHLPSQRLGEQQAEPLSFSATSSHRENLKSQQRTTAV